MDFLRQLSGIQNATTHLITAENVYGKKGAGAMAEYSPIPQEDVVKIGQSWDVVQDNGAARELGKGFKVRPKISLPGKSVTTIMDVDGPGRITHIWITTSNERYRSMIIRMYWDQESEPSVEVPLGEFFCNGWLKRTDVMAIPVNVNPTGGNNMYFSMPFRKHARITIENLDEDPVAHFFYAISYESCDIDGAEAYFHAQFRRTNPLPYGEDYVIVDGIRGQGNYVGTFMCWQQNNRGWWGEGEIKGYIDGDDQYPSYCGTGTEDYFGGAWCFKGDYSAPFLGYIDLSAAEGRPRNTVGNRHMMYRFHILDPIRFHSDFKLTMQALGWREKHRYLPLQDDISSVAYWYQTEPHAPFPPLPDKNTLEII